MRIRESLLGATIALVLSTSVFACGPDFPPELLVDRKASLLDLPEGTFAFESAHLVPKPATNYPVVDRAEWIYTGLPSRSDVERGWLGDAAYEKTLTMRAAATGAAAYAQGEGLPVDARNYTAGAVAYIKDDNAGAANYFAAVLALPAAQRPHYGVLAQFMLAAMAGGDVEAARNGYRATRALVDGGAVDPLGLAVTSFGDEARIALDLKDYVTAVGLYAQQAAAGSAFGRTSLLFVARKIARDPAQFDAAIADPVTQRLLAAYLYSRADELDYAQADDSQPATDAPAPGKAAPGQQLIARFLAAVEKRGLDHVEGADRLAALAYRHGDFDLAKRFAGKSDNGLAHWVRAKLALRDGDMARAAEAYAAASKAFPKDERWVDPVSEAYLPFDATQPSCRVEDERAIVALSRAEYVSALEHLYAAAAVYWPDAAYVAERVVSVDELKTFVDAKVPAVPKPAVVDPAAEAPPVSPAAQLRTLLARRLLRAERYDEALRYFDDAELKQKAEAYVAARRATAKGDRIELAQAWFTAAKAAREDGIDIIGYELAPDFQTYGGSFGDYGGDGEAAPKKPDGPRPYFGKDEQARVDASAPNPDKRFHYRYLAAGFAEKAADQLPPRSQAFAAVLCRATGWLIHRDPPAGARLYQRYVKQGAYVPWAADFGETCPEPDFAAAAARLHLERVRAVKHMARQAAPYVAGGLILIGGLLGWMWQKRRRRTV